MALSYSELEAVVKEIAPALTSGWIQKVFQPLTEAIVLEIRTPGRTLWLFLSADPQTARLHFISRRLPNPAEPPPFCSSLRTHIQGAQIKQIEQISDDRIVRIELSTPKGSPFLIAALTGKSANLFLINQDHLILNMLRASQTKVGDPYCLPTQKSLGQPRQAYQSETPIDAVSSPLVPDKIDPFPVSSMIERVYQGREEEQARTRLRDAQRAQLRKAIKKIRRRIEGLQNDYERALRYREYGRYGELLKGQLNAIAKGQEQVALVDYFDPALPELVIPLDPSKDAKGNMEDYFRKHRKSIAAERELQPRIEQAERELQTLQEGLRTLETSSTLEHDSFPLTPSVPRTGRKDKGKDDPRFERSGKKKTPPTRSGPFRRFVSHDGDPIWSVRAHVIMRN